MKRFTIALVLAATVGCNSPTSPSKFTCYTQPRVYYNPATGLSTVEIDHYDQLTPCPTVPIQ